ncbi:hypothetical protein CFE70_003906 [Pyrenophora teres f. teres 0-1]|uniref:Uncharacterized protein n=1 Tax=Pyrenophora teres f. teres (strain 0-1) TaxID=861557 RepID=E3RZA1_PYRTT|nr:hypothetical protein PTT_14954 [Pyrenophora teres f. teres 0-1]KAE8845623.1 hypothetical protein HRS9139_00190 [Pyrenophora teres f. teres]KAE8847760.1 hypothetical protein PTNB85_01603 [Pyrenophora teres f. teres]KAE8854083.1 hypothetical protein HRS9122_01075 [Pyrenophora teres f. teres]KAE8867687.1 hypothetical protein PTNB29_01598 [Pyrenophora teres f. teres]
MSQNQDSAELLKGVGAWVEDDGKQTNPSQADPSLTGSPQTNLSQTNPPQTKDNKGKTTASPFDRWLSEKNSAQPWSALNDQEK